jgi:hypothetical protein
MKQVVCLQQKLKNAGWGKTDRRDRATSHVSRDRKSETLPLTTGKIKIPPPGSAVPHEYPIEQRLSADQWMQ